MLHKNTVAACEFFTTFPPFSYVIFVWLKPLMINTWLWPRFPMCLMMVFNFVLFSCELYGLLYTPAISSLSPACKLISVAMSSWYSVVWTMHDSVTFRRSFIIITMPCVPFWQAFVIITVEPWAFCQIRKIAGRAHTWNALRVSDPDMCHGTCEAHVPWCMPGLLTSGFLWSR